MGFRQPQTNTTSQITKPYGTYVDFAGNNIGTLARGIRHIQEAVATRQQRSRSFVSKHPFCSLLMLPVLVPAMLDGQAGPDGTVLGNLHILLKSAIVLSSWILGYYSIKHLPLTIAGPINAARPVIVLVGALLIFGERLNALQWAGVTLGFFSLFFYIAHRG